MSLFTLKLRENDNCKCLQSPEVIFGHTHAHRNICSCHFRSILMSKNRNVYSLFIWSSLFGHLDSVILIRSSWLASKKILNYDHFFARYFSDNKVMKTFLSFRHVIGTLQGVLKIWNFFVRVVKKKFVAEDHGYDDLCQCMYVCIDRVQLNHQT